MEILMSDVQEKQVSITDLTDKYAIIASINTPGKEHQAYHLIKDGVDGNYCWMSTTRKIKIVFVNGKSQTEFVSIKQAIKCLAMFQPEFEFKAY